LLTGSLPYREVRKHESIGMAARRFSDLSGSEA